MPSGRRPSSGPGGGSTRSCAGVGPAEAPASLRELQSIVGDLGRTVPTINQSWEAGVKKLINAVDDFVKESLEGMKAAHGDLIDVNYDPFVVYRADAPVQGKVGVVSGGGSGHEPMHGVFVGRGMLDAACPGEVFTSPTPDQMLEATKAVDGGAGVLHIVKNYTGDVLNFEMAADLAKGEGVEVEA